MTEQTKQKLTYWLFGLFSGAAIATPVTAFVTKRICDKKKEEAVNEAMNEMAAYAVEHQIQEAHRGDDIYEEKSVPVVKDGLAEKFISEGVIIESSQLPDEDDINNYDLDIDDEEATEAALERTREHERYLDRIDKYKDSVEIVPRMIDAEKFIAEHYMEKSFVNWYSEDNVFEEDLMVIDDPYATFGVVDGSELFKDADERDDPDIVYIRNEKLTTDFEVTRIRGSYAKLVGGEGTLGQADT